MIQEYYSNGKLLIAGEYVVLDGVQAFALPTKYGQSLCVESVDTPFVYWTCVDADGSIWMKEEVSIDLLLSDTKIEGSAYLQTLVEVLRAAHTQNNRILQPDKGYRVLATLTFPRIWGLGTSSTWINNVAQWFGINAYQLLNDSFGGSGYDIACAQHDEGIFYMRSNQNTPTVIPIVFDPVFKEQLYFVYLNQKQSSKEAIANYRKKSNAIEQECKRIGVIGVAMTQCDNLESFEELMREHEVIMSKVLEVEPVQQRLFADFEGTIKSLGAWGGDFVLVASKEDPTAYFKAKGYTTLLMYNDMIK
ncbi:MAG: GHMP kinase [Flavobacteriaceae bacterium]|jgi:mevalonate kinase|nr:GHMP kinase [Flavobacteriaceae bacterium]